jgi:DNA-binding NtrC family response regulator
MSEVLIISPERDARVYLTTVLREEGFTVSAFGTADEGLTLLEDAGPAVGLTILDLESTPAGGDVLIASVRKVAPEAAVAVLVAGPLDKPARKKLLDAGAADVLPRDELMAEGYDICAERIQSLLRGLLAAQGLRDEVATLRRRDALMRDFEARRYRIVGDSPAFAAVLAQARKLASIPRPVLVLGERGTGKEMVAATMHFAGSRARQPFVTVNCAAFQGTLLEAELFGHEKGAFTGADKRRIGRFEMADGGTLFLDEIGNMAPEFQEKILRLIEYQEFERVRGTDTIRVDVRVVAGTNVDLQQRIDDGRFRADLYDRLAFATLQVPPLRERAVDIPALAKHFIQQMCHEVPDVVPKTFHPDTMKVLQAYRWPGNVRELRNVVERMLCVLSNDPVLPSDLPPELTAAPPAAVGFKEKVAEFERQLLYDALEATGGNQKDAAAAISLTYDQFRHLLRKYEIKPD